MNQSNLIVTSLLQLLFGLSYDFRFTRSQWIRLHRPTLANFFQLVDRTSGSWWYRGWNPAAYTTKPKRFETLPICSAVGPAHSDTCLFHMLPPLLKCVFSMIFLFGGWLVVGPLHFPPLHCMILWHCMMLCDIVCTLFLRLLQAYCL